jgi:hypothetical protein
MFDFYFQPSYPSVPPLVHLKTTGAALNTFAFGSDMESLAASAMSAWKSIHWRSLPEREQR